MTTPEAILHDLILGQSTAEAVAARQRVPLLTIEAMLRDHARDGLAETVVLPCGMTVWRITGKGREGRKPKPGFARQPHMPTTPCR